MGNSSRKSSGHRCVSLTLTSEVNLATQSSTISAEHIVDFGRVFLIVLGKKLHL